MMMSRSSARWQQGPVMAEPVLPTCLVMIRRRSEDGWPQNFDGPPSDRRDGGSGRKVQTTKHRAGRGARRRTPSTPSHGRHTAGSSRAEAVDI